MKLIVVRHAETNYNVLRLCNDDPAVDVHLTEAGIAQTQILSEKLKTEPIDEIIASELPRTKQTAQIINEHHNLEVLIDARLNDIHNGFEGRSVDEYRQFVLASQDPWTTSFNDCESYADVSKRVRDFLQDIRRGSSEVVLFVTSQIILKHIHGQINNLLQKEIMNLDAKNLQLEEFQI